ncbi:GNAT family N-acetyltransferase [Pseudohoeflea coraliihabitans]
MQTSDAAIAAALHLQAFSRPWGDGEFFSLLSQPATFGFLAADPSLPRIRASGFVLAREAAGEAEILSIAVHPAVRRRSLGWRLMLAAIREAANRGAEELFLEVDEHNGAAIALYRRLGFTKVGERTAYYQHRQGEQSAAWIMRMTLNPETSTGAAP